MQNKANQRQPINSSQLSQPAGWRMLHVLAATTAGNRQANVRDLCCHADICRTVLFCDYSINRHERCTTKQTNEYSCGKSWRVVPLHKPDIFPTHGEAKVRLTSRELFVVVFKNIFRQKHTFRQFCSLKLCPPHTYSGCTPRTRPYVYLVSRSTRDRSITTVRQ